VQESKRGRGRGRAGDWTERDRGDLGTGRSVVGGGRGLGGGLGRERKRERQLGRVVCPPGVEWESGEWGMG
jgi:hypothetical protein